MRSSSALSEAPLGYRRPTLGLLRELVRLLPIQSGPADAWALCRPLVDAGLAEILNGDAPRSEWLLRVPPPIWTAIRGERPAQPMPGLAYRPPDAVPTVEDLIIGERQRERAALQVRHLLATTLHAPWSCAGWPGASGSISSRRSRPRSAAACWKGRSFNPDATKC